MKLVCALFLTLAITVSATALPSASAAGSSSDPCGAQRLKPDGSPWTCTFSDDFSGNTLDRSKWLPQTSFKAGALFAYACYVDDPSTVSVGGGSLNLTVRRSPTPVNCGFLSVTGYVAGMVTTYHLFSQQYGRIQARVKNTGTTQPGLHEAFWMWPDDQYGTASMWPDSGEIDVAETFSVYPRSYVAALHYSADELGLDDGITSGVCDARRGVWNTYTLEWSPQKLEFFVNGKSCLVNTSGDPAFQKPYIINFTEGIGPVDMDNMPTARTPIPATYKVDYVKVWE